MKHVAAYMLAQLGGKTPDAANITAILSSVGAEADSAKLTEFLAAVDGKDPVELLAAGRAKMASLGGAGRNRGAAPGSTASTGTRSLPDGPVAIQLQKVSARAVEGAAAAGSFYVGTVWAGHPAQELQVMFDTASGNVILPHRACRSTACREHRRYSAWESDTSVDVNFDGTPVQRGRRHQKGNITRDCSHISFTQADLGEGEATSVVLRDDICVGAGLEKGRACFNLLFMGAIKMDDVPFRAMPNDGIIGLSLEGLALNRHTSFFAQLAAGAGGRGGANSSGSFLPQFGLSLGAEGGELYLGGHDSARLAAPLQWFPVDHPEQGFWQIAILAVRVGGVTVDACEGGCHGVIDSGASRLGVQKGRLPQLRAALASSRRPSGGPRRGCQGPELVFDLGGMELALGAGDYADPAAACAPELGPLDLEEPVFRGVYALGATVLRSYYAAFDWQTRQVGFAPVAGRFDDRRGAKALTAIPAVLAGGVFV